MSLDGWLRGTKALTVLILQGYTPEDAELLRQPALLDRFDTQLGIMPSTATVSRMQGGVRKMRALVAGSDRPTPEKSLRDLATLCDELLALIEAKGADAKP